MGQHQAKMGRDGHQNKVIKHSLCHTNVAVIDAAFHHVTHAFNHVYTHIMLHMHLVMYVMYI
jgi:hypothetical protein